jgi:hypothetical protein
LATSDQPPAAATSAAATATAESSSTNSHLSSQRRKLREPANMHQLSHEFTVPFNLKLAEVGQDGSLAVLAASFIDKSTRLEILNGCISEQAPPHQKSSNLVFEVC